MVSSKLIAVVFANLALLASVNAGPCKPQSIATSATETASVTFASDTTTALSTTIQASTAITATETTKKVETTTTLTEDGTTMSASVSEASTSIAISESTTVVSSSDTTIASSVEVTTAPTTTEGTTTAAESPTTTTTVEAESTELLINGNFDLGTVDPWLSDNEPIQLGSSSPYEGPAYALLQFDVSEEGESLNNGVYQKIDKSLLKASTYRLSARLLVDYATDSQFNDGCNAMAIVCYYGDPININPVQGGAKTVSADAADGRWAPLSVDCSLRQDKLDQYGYLSVYIGFSCAAVQAAVDAVTFEEVIL
ncbi:hypothetical protein FVEG_07747 [Fusarium verticillioides 7600]|uniref:CBM-cenC domain-containing protein n=1 Tax=Gibberella moniliformis (strain M3125 / FGSC 7600) TaxID=334819 RepID=W7MT21_GIBM7|nr:hypothetical protein FVEG_07747 [Fusarium verticillioides 7600]EWG47692.1 hypothetical protein FVEG_07747 [Fusarium verticillioides 7600]RBQ78551.1 hypothetical protein FVER14953_07747 [Fusarium verticillioides]RBQ94712.1 hypothetical protein FVER53263_07747 [Fusarium verticillioides]